MVIPKFSRDVLTFQINDSLAIMLKAINEKNYTQFPVYDDNEFVGLISENGVTNWLAKNVSEDIISLIDTPLKSIIKCEENKNNYNFISRSTSVYEAEEIFKEFTTNGSKLDALLITHSGNKKESLLGIITPWDIININEK